MPGGSIMAAMNAGRPREANDANFPHVGPRTLAGRYLRRFWQPVYRAADLPAGWAKPLRILGEDFTLYRGEGGQPHIVAFRCAHRGTQLSTGWVEGDCLRCFYHGWKYDASGQCVEMPAEDPSFPPKVKIRSYPTEEYLGLIFAYLGEDEAPPLPRFPERRTRRRACVRCTRTPGPATTSRRWRTILSTATGYTASPTSPPGAWARPRSRVRRRSTASSRT